MSLLSKVTGIHISKHGAHIEPLKALGTLATVGSFGGLGPVAGALGHIPGATAAMSGIGKAGAALKSLPGAAKAGAVLSGLKKVGGSSGMPPSVDVNGIVNHSGVLDSMSGGEDGGGFMGGLKKVGSFLGDHGDQLLGAASLGEGYLGQRRANNLQNEALGIAKQSYADRAGLRKLGVSQMMDQTAPDLSSTFAQPSNPYGRQPLRKVG